MNNKSELIVSLFKYFSWLNDRNIFNKNFFLIFQVSGREALTGGGGGHAPRPASTAEPPQASPSPASASAAAPSGARTAATATAALAASVAVALQRRQQFARSPGAAATGQQPPGPGPGWAARITNSFSGPSDAVPTTVGESRGDPVSTTEELDHRLPHGHQRRPQGSSGSHHLWRPDHGHWRGKNTQLIQWQN